jgi:beta-N-acetylhexosaminidase
MTKAVIFGCSGPVLTPEERAFFAAERPWGFILFRRNVETPDQVRALVQALRESIDDTTAPVLIDQEGGRVQRLGPPHWPKYPTGRAYADHAANDPVVGQALARLGGRLMAADLARLGINVDCVPVLDVPQPGGHDVIGDRAYGDTVESVIRLGRAVAEGMIAGGVLPVIKHIPGHGRSTADSHHALPVVDATLEALEAVDFPPFEALSDMPMAMTAHVVYRAIDRNHPATTSKKAIRLIRERLGFGGLIMSDDLSMKALSGSLADRTKASLRAGCDVVLHCNGVMTEMVEIAAAAGRLKGRAAARAEAALARIARRPEPLNETEARARFAAAFGGQGAIGLDPTERLTTS